MKTLLLIFVLTTVTSVFAGVGETTTDCPAMSQNREKNVQPVKKKAAKTNTAIKQ